jgi:hypothetical protein
MKKIHHPPPHDDPSPPLPPRRKFSKKHTLNYQNTAVLWAVRIINAVSTLVPTVIIQHYCVIVTFYSLITNNTSAYMGNTFKRYLSAISEI